MQLSHRKKIGIGVMLLQMAAICFIPAMAGASALKPGEPARPGGPAKEMEAPCHRPPAPPLGMWRDARMIKYLELSDTQVSQLRKADFAARETEMTVKAQLDSLQLKMEQAFTNETIDDAAVRELAVKIAEAQGKLFVQRIESQLDIGKILTPDQLDKMKKPPEQPKRHGHRHGMKKMNSGPPAERTEN